MASDLMWIGLAYCLIDFVTAILFKRCVMPGLKCRACRDGE